MIPIAALYHDDGIEYLAKRPDEILTDILLPPADGWRSVYLKLRRRGSFDFPVLGVAVALRMDGDIVARGAHRARRGGLAAARGREAARRCSWASASRPERDRRRRRDLAARPSKPLDNTDFTHPYRKKMTRVFVARALRRLAGLPDVEEAA